MTIRIQTPFGESANILKDLSFKALIRVLLSIIVLNESPITFNLFVNYYRMLIESIKWVAHKAVTRLLCYILGFMSVMSISTDNHNTNTLKNDIINLYTNKFLLYIILLLFHFTTVTING